MLLLLAVLTLAFPAMAEEVIHFTNGTSMAIQSHTVEEGALRVRLSTDAIMAFPLDQVDHIETTDGVVTVMPEPGANRMVPGSSSGYRSSSVGGTARTVLPSRHRGRAWDGGVREENPSIGTAKNGLAVFKPFANGPPNRRGFGLTGRRELYAGSNAGGRPGLAQTTQIGGRHVLNTKQSNTKAQVIGIGTGSRAAKK
jgi:hypothetical protein